METLAKALLALGLLIALAGGLLLLLSKLGVSRFPGDVVVRRGRFTLYAPIGLMIAASILLTILLNLFRR